MKILAYTELEQERSWVSKIVANTSCKLKEDEKHQGVPAFTVHFSHRCPKQSALMVGCTFVISK
tara:strand:+ start:2034 stop:2225 length:192 start_codon:yes stop_codon:yes gene_type:complete